MSSHSHDQQVFVKKAISPIVEQRGGKKQREGCVLPLSAARRWPAGGESSFLFCALLPRGGYVSEKILISMQRWCTR